jgi:hypothetical protein
VAPNPSNNLISAWFPQKLPSKAKEQITDYSAREKDCDITQYDPFDADKHWPRVGTNVAFAGTFGHLKTDQQPHIDLPDSDLVGRFITGGIADELLHEGADINWGFSKDFTQPEYRNLIGPTPDSYCYGENYLINQFAQNSEQLALSCTNNELIATCGATASEEEGCSPWDVTWNRAKKSCSYMFTKDCTDTAVCGTVEDVCSHVFLGWLCGAICDAAACTAAVVADTLICASSAVSGVENLLWQYGGGLACLGFLGHPCGDEGLVVYKKPGEEQELDIELEHRLAHGLNNEPHPCTTTGLCKFTDYHQQNGVYAYMGSQKTSLVDVNSQLLSQGLLAGAALDNKKYPFVLAPGIFHANSSIFGRSLLRQGEFDSTNAFGYNEQKDSISVLPEKMAKSYLAKFDGKVGPGFRVEFLGDLISDCGHEQLHLEIHPPTNIMLHASTPEMGSARRYSLFAQARYENSLVPLAPFDLWPGPRPKGKSTLFFHILSPVNDSPVSSNLDCAPFPDQNPNRIRCQLVSKDTGDFDICSHNNRMLPHCAKTVGGGLVEVDWK